MAQIITDANGQAVFTGTPGRYRFDVQPPAGYRDAADVTADITDSQDTPVFFQLAAQAGTATVVVRDLATGLPLSGVAVEITAVVP